MHLGKIINRNKSQFIQELKPNKIKVKKYFENIWKETVNIKKNRYQRFLSFWNWKFSPMKIKINTWLTVREVRTFEWSNF